MSQKSKFIIIAIILALICFFAFESVRKNGFINFDDDDYITNNPLVQMGLSWTSVKWAFTTGHAANWHPLTWISHMVDYELFGLNPAGHHLINLGFHIVNTLLLFWILWLMTGSLWKSAFVAALFSLFCDS